MDKVCHLVAGKSVTPEEITAALAEENREERNFLEKVQIMKPCQSLSVPA